MMVRWDGLAACVLCACSGSPSVYRSSDDAGGSEMSSTGRGSHSTGGDGTSSTDGGSGDVGDSETSSTAVLRPRELVRRIDGRMPELVTGGCVGIGEGDGGGVYVGSEFVVAEDRVVFRYFIASPDASADLVTPDNGELVAEIDMSTESLWAGDVGYASFMDHDDAHFEAFVWADDCAEVFVEPPDAP
ncbi:MAG: hypothetical protein ACRBN8_14600 [Nannocystales bacterium]